jgi:hypothetical protein
MPFLAMTVVLVALGIRMRRFPVRVWLALGILISPE